MPTSRHSNLYASGNETTERQSVTNLLDEYIPFHAAQIDVIFSSYLSRGYALGMSSDHLGVYLVAVSCLQAKTG